MSLIFKVMIFYIESCFWGNLVFLICTFSVGFNPLNVDIIVFSRNKLPET